MTGGSQRRRPFPKVSVIVPLYNEADGVSELLRELDQVLQGLDEQIGHEVLCIDDGSFDDTLERLAEQVDKYPFLKVVSLSRNFGHQAAVTAGFDHCKGDVAFVIDGDLQDDPAVLPKFIDEYRDGADVVYATRIARKETVLLRAAYALHYRLLAMMSTVEIPVDAGDFALVSRRVIDALRSMPERQRYLRGMRAWAGFRQVGVPVERRGRYAGRSKYGFWALLRLALDGLLAFSVVPLRMATILGLLGLLAGFAYGMYAVVARLATGSVPEGFTSLALLQIGFGGAVLLTLGVVGEYVGRIYEEVKARPIYIVASTLEADDG